MKEGETEVFKVFKTRQAGVTTEIEFSSLKSFY